MSAEGRGGVRGLNGNGQNIIKIKLKRRKEILTGNNNNKIKKH